MLSQTPFHFALAVLCCLMFTGCAVVESESPGIPDARDGHIEELVAAGKRTANVGKVVFTIEKISAGHPFKGEYLVEVEIPSSCIEDDDLTNSWSAAGRLARASFSVKPHHSTERLASSGIRGRPVGLEYSSCLISDGS